jgi:TatD DNase family protein
LIDSHCHLDLDDFDNDRDQVIKACLNKGISQILIPGVSPSRWDKQIMICRQYPELVLALGVHPHFLSDSRDISLQALDTILAENKHEIVAVGEIGLDFHLSKQSGGASESLQQTIFEKQLILATRYELPVIVHHRQSHNQIIRTLKNVNFEQGGVIHAFSGSAQEAQSYIDMGFLLGVGGTITYERASKTRQTINDVKLEHLLLETDSPDMPLQGYQGQRNSPVRVVEIARHLAALKSISIEQVSQQTDENFRRLFLSGL